MPFFDGVTPTREVLSRCGVDVESLDEVTEARVSLASSANAYVVPAR